MSNRFKVNKNLEMIYTNEGIYKDQKIYKTTNYYPDAPDETFYGIADEGGWLPGAYESEEAATYAFTCSYDHLSNTMDLVAPNLVKLIDLKVNNGQETK